MYDRLTDENKTNQNIENLSVITRQVEKALEYANGIADALKATSGKADSVNTGIRERKSPLCQVHFRMLKFTDKCYRFLLIMMTN